MWIARNENGSLWLFETEPKRCFEIWSTLDDPFWERRSENKFMVDRTMFPELKWEDEPIEVELVSKNINTDKRDKWIEETIKNIRKSVESRYQDCHYKDNYFDEVRDALKEGYDKAVEDILGNK